MVIQQIVEENQASDSSSKSKSTRDPLVEFDSIMRFTRGENERVDMTNSPKQAKVPKDRTETAKAQIPILINPEEGENDQHHRNPNLGVSHPTGLLKMVQDISSNQ